MDFTFDPIDYLSSLTTFVFDKSLLRRIAAEVRLNDATCYEDVSEEQRDKCRISLYEAIYFSPSSIAGTTQKHGDFSLQVTQQTITDAEREVIGAELKRLYKKYGMDDEEEALESSSSVNVWIDEGRFA